MFWPPELRANSREKTLMLGKTEGMRRRGWQRMRWLDIIIDSMDMSRPQEVVKYREAWHTAVHWVAKSRTWVSHWTTSGDSPAALPFTPFIPIPHSLLLSCSWSHSRSFPWRKVVSLSFHIFIVSVLSCLTLKSLCSFSSSLPFLPPLLAHFLHFSFSTFFPIVSSALPVFRLSSALIAQLWSCLCSSSWREFELGWDSL